MRPFHYERALSVAEAIRAEPDGETTQLIAGGTTLIDLLKLDVVSPERLVDISRLPLDQIEGEPGGGLRIGANVRNSDLAWDERVKRDYPALSQAILSGASPQLRNMATTAGNLMQRTRCPYFRDNYSECNKRSPGTGCAALDGYSRSHAVLGVSDSCIAAHPSDMCVALAAYGASVIALGVDGERVIDFADFHLLPGATPHREHALHAGEVITAVELRPPPANSRSLYLKLRDRQSFEFALVSVAVVLTLKGEWIDRVRIAFGGVGTKPWRSEEAEQALVGRVASAEQFNRAADAAMEGARTTDRNAFKVVLAKRALLRALRLLCRSERGAQD